ncbi:hypothetical protein BGX24_000384 [Mortierella sp. AD032]|nr:hypothetical protein BGX24_000384 [Mortierella sp. AD032]
MTNGSLPSVKKPFKPRGPRGPYKPRQPKINTTVPVLSRAVANGSTPKPSSELAFKDARAWHDYFVKRTPSFNKSSSVWEFCPPSPREDVLAPEELDKMIADDYARMKPLPSGGNGKNNRPISHREGSGIGEAGTEGEPAEMRAREQQSSQPSNNDANKNKKNQEETHEQAQDADSDSQWDDSGSDSDDIEDTGSRRSQSFTPGPSGDSTGTGGLRRRVSKHRPRIKYRFPAPIPPLEYPYLQAGFPYESKQPPKQHASTQTDYGGHSQPLSDLWHRPQGNFAMEDLFSQDKLDYSIKMLRRQPIESNKLRLDLYYRRGFQLAARQVLDRARVAYYRRHDHDNKHTLQVPNLFNEIDEARLRSSKRSRKDINILRCLDIKGKIALREHSLLSTPPTTGDITTSTLVIPETATAPFSGMPAPGSSLSSTAPTSHAGASSSRTPQNQPQTTGGSDDRTRATERMAYYEVNQFLATMFNHRNIGSKLVCLSPKACTILRTLMGGLEKKLVSMGCKLQRAELTRRLAEIDTFLSSRTRERNRTRKEKHLSERDGPHQGEMGSLALSLPTRSPSPAPATTPTPMSPFKELMGAHAAAAYERPFYPLLDVDPVDYYIRTIATSCHPHDPRFTMVTSAFTPPESDRGHEDRTTIHVPGPSKNVEASQEQAKPSYPAATSAMLPSTITATITTAESGLPFVTNPLRIPDEMEPFWRVRNYVERISATAVGPSATTNRSTEIERLRQAQREISASEPSTSSCSPMVGMMSNQNAETVTNDAASSHSPSVISRTPTRTTLSSMTTDIERLRLAQQQLARATPDSLSAIS